MAGEVRKENLLLLSNVIAMRQLVSLNATGFACRTLATIISTMPVYDLKNTDTLKHDFKHILGRLNDLYVIDMADEQFTLLPKLIDNSNAFWATEENTEVFNGHVPTFKSLHKDMHAFIEAHAKQKLGDKYIGQLEKMYPDFKEFRVLNNLFKHFETREVEITLTKIVFAEQNRFDLLCNFHYQDNFKCVRYPDFIILFLTILKDLNVIRLEK